MKKIVLALSMMHCVVATYAEKVRVACIGNSITYGHDVVDREVNSYPARLQEFLGSDYEVRNFGVSATTLLTKGDYPYITTDAYRQSLEYNPDIVLIKLGTNDSKPWNVPNKDQFKDDYIRLIETYQALPATPRIILLTPVRCFLSDADINDEVIQKEIRPQIEEIAYERNLEIINMYNLFGDKHDPELMPDHLHPSAKGAEMMASHIAPIMSQQKIATPEILRNGSVAGNAKFNFFGYEGVDFDFKNNPCKLVRPKRAAEGNPWVLRARFWGHAPQADIALLERGYHIAYCDVADLYGAPKAVKRWDDFYTLMTRSGLNSKVVLEGLSRGGLILYNWAVKNTDKVACIYADAPVMDFKSWPFALYSDNYGSEEDELRLKMAYKFFDVKEILKWKKNPVDHARVFAKAGVPILHVVGDQDDIVPPSENTAVFAERLEKEGGKMEVIRKPGIGHHPHSLTDPTPIVEFILRSCGLIPSAPDASLTAEK